MEQNQKVAMQENAPHTKIQRALMMYRELKHEWRGIITSPMSVLPVIELSVLRFVPRELSRSSIGSSTGASDRVVSWIWAVIKTKRHFPKLHSVWVILTRVIRTGLSHFASVANVSHVSFTVQCSHNLISNQVLWEKISFQIWPTRTWDVYLLLSLFD